MKGVNKLRVKFRGVLDNLRTSCVTVNTAKSVWHRYCDEMQKLAKPKEACHLKNYGKMTLNSSKY